MEVIITRAVGSDIMKYFDLHSHFLPGIDDGCKNCQESLQVLLESKKQGVIGIAATPHYYPKETVDDFLKRRNDSYQQLSKYLLQENKEIPDICLGAEVAYRTGISKEPKLQELCYGKSEFILLELPFTKWNSGILYDIEQICLVHGLIPVIAHFERYAGYQDKKVLNELMDMNVLIQMNAEYYLDFWNRGSAKKKILKQQVQVLGSDCHNLDRRSPNIGIAADMMKKKGLEKELLAIMEQNREIFVAASYK